MCYVKCLYPLVYHAVEMHISRALARAGNGLAFEEERRVRSLHGRYSAVPNRCPRTL